MPPVPPDAHKGTRGRVLVAGGSPGLTGAAALAAEAAVRTGAGLVTLAAPAGIVPILAAKLTCAMTRPLAETAEGALHVDALESLLAAAARATVVAAGPGLGRHPLTSLLVRRLVAASPVPLVLDADALWALAEDLRPLAAARTRGAAASAVLTPHAAEMARLLRSTPEDVLSRRADVAQRFAAEHGVVLLLKGPGTLVASPDGRLYRNATGNPGLATGGTGDVLTGVIAALVARGLAAFDAACLGAHLHGLAADLACEHIPEACLTAADVLAAIPEAIRADGASGGSGASGRAASERTRRASGARAPRERTRSEGRAI